MELSDRAVDSIGLARSLGIDGARARNVKVAVDMTAKALTDGTSVLINVDMEHGYKPV